MQTRRVTAAVLVLLAAGLGAMTLLRPSHPVPAPEAPPSPAASSTGDDGRALRLTYLHFMRTRSFHQGTAHFRALRARFPNRALLAALEGGSLVDSGEDDAARLALEQALKADPRCSPAHAFLGNLSAFRGDLDAARAEYRQALDCADDALDRSTALSSLANIAFWRGDLVEARRGYTQAYDLLDESMTRGRLLQQLAMVEELEGHGDETVRLLLQGLREQHHSGAGAQLGEYHLTGGRHAEAEKALDEAVQVGANLARTARNEEPGSFTSWSRGIDNWNMRLLIRACLAQGKQAKVAHLGRPFFHAAAMWWPVDLANACRSIPERPSDLPPAASPGASAPADVGEREARAYHGLGERALEEDDPTRALRCYTFSVQKSPPGSDAWANDLVSVAYLRLWQGDRAGAAGDIDRVLQARPQHGRAIVVRTAIDLAEGREEQAEQVARGLMTAHSDEQTLKFFTNVLLQRGKLDEVIRLVDARRHAGVSLIVLRAMLRLEPRGKALQDCVAVSILSERNIGPGPEHVELWRRLHAPATVTWGPHAWDTW